MLQWVSKAASTSDARACASLPLFEIFSCNDNPTFDHAPVPAKMCEARHLDEEGKVVLDLGDTVRKMKTDFGVEQVLTWHAVVGYWAGVAPEAGGMQAFNPFFTRLLAPEGIRRVDPQVRRTLTW